MKKSAMSHVRFILSFLCASYSIVLLFLTAPAMAVEPDEILMDPALEQRARTLSLELRCLVCQNQSIDDSDAPLARDLRLLVRERLKDGDTDQQVLDFVVQRYGEFVLLRPPFATHTLLLWLAPLLILAMAIWLARSILARRAAPSDNSTQVESSLSQSEQERLAQILAENSKE